MAAYYRLFSFVKKGRCQEKRTNKDYLFFLLTCNNILSNVYNMMVSGWSAGRRLDPQMFFLASVWGSDVGRRTTGACIDVEVYAFAFSFRIVCKWLAVSSVDTMKGLKIQFRKTIFIHELFSVFR